MTAAVPDASPSLAASSRRLHSATSLGSPWATAAVSCSVLKAAQLVPGLGKRALQSTASSHCVLQSFWPGVSCVGVFLTTPTVPDMLALCSNCLVHEFADARTRIRTHTRALRMESLSLIRTAREELATTIAAMQRAQVLLIEAEQAVLWTSNGCSAGLSSDSDSEEVPALANTSDSEDEEAAPPATDTNAERDAGHGAALEAVIEAALEASLADTA